MEKEISAVSIVRPFWPGAGVGHDRDDYYVAEDESEPVITGVVNIWLDHFDNSFREGLLFKKVLLPPGGIV